MKTLLRSGILPLPLLLLTLLLVPAPLSLFAAAPDSELTFERDILPIFRDKCIRCHAGVEPKAGLNLTSPASLLTGGKSGAALRIGAAEFSRLYEKVTSGEMPPVGQQLTTEEKGRLRKWINDGANGLNPQSLTTDTDQFSGVEHWAFRPPVRPAVPQVRQQQFVRNPIDAFLLHSLEAHNLTFASEADPATLLRRATFDLTGLPPSPAELREFLAEQHPDAFERALDRLLASPHYGERWARHWLDVAGYTESAGILSEDRPIPNAWRFRDYVIRAFNADKPWDRFLQEQIAGDELTNYWSHFETQAELPADAVEGIIATGYLRTAADSSRPDFSTIKNAAGQYFYPTLFDTLQIVCSSTMGLTMQCARCHSHKFDPIPQTDYFRLQAVFTSVYRPDKWIPQMERRLLIASKQQQEQATRTNADVDAAVKTLNEQATALKTTFTARLFDDRLAALPGEIRDDVRAALDTPAPNRSEIQKYLAEKFERSLRPQAKDLDMALAAIPDYKTESDRIAAQIAAEQARRIQLDEVRAAYDLPGEPTTPLLLRGDPLTPGPLVAPGVLSALAAPQPFTWQTPGADAKTSGRRLAFARWLTQPEHPLTARVIVNRVWMHHFGAGLVSTPEDFGVSGSPPSHPELLDWLATEFVRSGWSIKQLHRLILTSAAWRQHSRVSEQHQAACQLADPQNRLLWKQNLRRLEAEPLRDAILAVSGTLSSRMYGPSQPVARQGSGEVIVSGETGQHRRSIYVAILRLNPETMLEIFDQPTMSVNCVQRSTSTVSTQALAMLNSDAMNQAAAAFAERILRDRPEDPIGVAVETAWCRSVIETERMLLQGFVDEQTTLHLQQRPETERQQPEMATAARQKALTDLCHMLLSANEFAYID
ncbi:MAG: PSD1 and planctomycete cytochrome C domain-containing protein [Planctomycetota bacterium]